MTQILENVPLAPLTTLKIGGKARFFARTEKVEDIFRAFEFADRNNHEIFVLGGGSNVLISDNGFDGVVLQVALKGIETVAEKNGTVHLTVGAGEDWDSLVGHCVERKLAGIECLSGIPGFVGGTPVQNVGAYGQEVAETIISVSVFDRRRREIKCLTNAECGFEYRKSIFNTSEKNRYIVLSVTYALRKNGEPKIAYQDLKKFFDTRSPDLEETRRAVLEIRRRKSMVIDENDPNTRSAGSFFKNPLVRKVQFADIEKTAKALQIIADNENVPHFAAGADLVKIPAAWLIEKAGFQKGYTKGRVGLSLNHTLALTNRGDATAGELISLKNEIQARVLEIFGVELIPEPVFVGFE